MEDKIKVLEQFKAEKEAEQRNFNNRSKKLDKKMKAVNEKEAKVDLEKRQLERSKLKTREDETLGNNSEPIVDYSNNNSPVTVETKNSVDAETSENNMFESDVSKENTLTKDDVKKIMDDWVENNRWFKTDNG